MTQSSRTLASEAVPSRRFPGLGVLVLAVALALACQPAHAAVIQLPADLAVWLRATDVTTSGSTVTAWTDLSGNGFDASLSAGGPTLVANAINGLPAVEFGNSAEHRRIGSIGLGGGFTAFIVGQEISPFISNERALQIGNITTGANGTTVGVDINNTGGTGGAGTRYNNGNNLFSPGWNSDTSTYHITQVAMADGSRYDSSTYALNGSPGTFITSTSPANTVSFTGANDTGYTLGRGVSNTGGVSDAFSGRIAEVLIFREVLTPQQANDLNYYLAQRYNLPTSSTIPAALVGADIYFDNVAGTGSWHSGTNWDLAIQPTNTNNTFIHGGLTATLSATGAATANLTVGSESTGGPNTPGIGTLNITGGDLAVSGTLRVGGSSNATRGTINQSGGAVTVAGGLTFGGDTGGSGTQSLYHITGGTLDVTGSIAHASGAVRGHLYVDSPDALTVSGDIDIQSFRTGDSAAGTHTVNPGQTLTTTGTLLVGRAAQGHLTLRSTGNSADNMRVGETSGSAGSTLILDDGASLTVGATSVGTTGFGGGTINVVSGTLQATSTLYIAGDATGAGNTSGHLIVGNGTTNPTVTVASNLEVGRGGAGQFTLNSGTVNVTGANFVLAQTGGSGSAQATINGGTLNVGNPGGTNEFNVNSGTGGATIDHFGGTVNVARDMRLANNNATAGSRTYNLDGGTLNIGRHLRLGDNGSATLNYESGTLNINNVLYLGGTESTSPTANPDANGTLNIGVGGGTPTLTIGQFEVGRQRVGTVHHAGGTVNVNATHNLVIGQYANSTGTYNLTGGTLNVGVGSGSQGNMTFNSGTGTFNQSGGTATIARLRMKDSGSGTAELNLSGGAFAAGNFTHLSAGNNSHSTINISSAADVTLPAFPTARGSGSTATITFDGGTLRNSAPSAAYMGGLTNAFIKAGGATFNTTNGHITIAQDLLEDAGSPGGGLIKEGANTLTLAGDNTYTGETLVSTGTLALSHASNNSIADSPLVRVDFSASLDVTGLAGGTFNVAGGQTLGGNGMVAGNVNVAGTGAILSPGMSVGTLGLGGDLTFAAGAFFDIDIEDVNFADHVQMAGGALDPNEAVIRVNLGFRPELGESWTILDGESELLSLFNPDVTVLSGANYLDGWKRFEVSYGNSVILTLVPEPGTWLLLAYALAAGLLIRRRR